MRFLFVWVAMGMLVAGCTMTNQLPDPYVGYEHHTLEHGYWREITAGKVFIGELHFHEAGFSTTFLPFETYKDYWGAYAIKPGESRIAFKVASGNTLPGFRNSLGTFMQKSENKISISGIPLDPRRPGKREFEFVRFFPNKR